MGKSRENPDTLTVATYNVHGWKGRDGRRAPERVIKVIRAFRADIIALQEVSLPWQSEGGVSIGYLSQSTGMTVIPGLTLSRKNADYGNLLMSVHPIASVKYLDLSIGGREPRGAIVARLVVGKFPFKVMTTHLGLRASERRRQFNRLWKEMNSEANNTLILMGDLNEWNPWSKPSRLLRQFFKSRRSPFTYPAILPFLALDQIFVRPGNILNKICVFKTPLTRIASDHLPLTGTINL